MSSFEFVETLEDDRLKYNEYITFSKYSVVSIDDPIRDILKDVNPSVLDANDFPQYSFWISRGKTTITFSAVQNNRKLDGRVIVLRNRPSLEMASFRGDIQYGWKEDVLTYIFNKRDATIRVESIDPQRGLVILSTDIEVASPVFNLLDAPDVLPIVSDMESDEEVHAIIYDLIALLHCEDKWETLVKDYSLEMIMRCIRILENHLLMPPLFDVFKRLWRESSDLTEEAVQALKKKYH